VALHVAVAAAFMISWGNRELKVGSVVPVTIVSTAPDMDTRPAVQAPETQTAATEEPVAEAPPEPVPPPPTPTPTPPTPTPPPKPAPTPTPKAAPPTKSTTKPAEKSLDLDALAASLTRPARNAPQRPSAAPKGPSRAETAPVARNTTGTGLAAGIALQGLQDELMRRWNPNCLVQGGGDVMVKATFRLGVGGQLIGDVATQITSAKTPVAQVAAERAARAVYATAPMRGLPPEFYRDTISVTFDAREFCANR
jgi:outer membrane biosynthesis protein TonB